MKEQLETIIENEFDCLIDDLECLMKQGWVADSIKKVVAQAFALGVVSNQRELLQAFQEKYNEENTEEDVQIYDHHIDDFINSL